MLSTPPAFVLSQDQTLHQDMMRAVLAPLFELLIACTISGFFVMIHNFCTLKFSRNMLSHRRFSVANGSYAKTPQEGKPLGEAWLVSVDRYSHAFSLFSALFVRAYLYYLNFLSLSIAFFFKIKKLWLRCDNVSIYELRKCPQKFKSNKTPKRR